jgi:hypothetical protein
VCEHSRPSNTDVWNVWSLTSASGVLRHVLKIMHGNNFTFIIFFVLLFLIICDRRLTVADFDINGMKPSDYSINVLATEVKCSCYLSAKVY